MSVRQQPRPPLGSALLLVAALCLCAPQVSAQYMFLDVTGDGIYSGDDQVFFDQHESEPITVDVYLETDRDASGRPAGCYDPSEATLRSYAVNLYSYGAPFVVTDAANQLPGMSETVPLVTYPYALSVGYGGSEPLPPGKYHLLRMTMTFQHLLGECPDLNIVPSSCYAPEGVVTSFGSGCPGSRSDYQLRCGEDWVDVAGLYTYCTTENRAGSLSCPEEVTGVEGEPLEFSATVTDPDCYVENFWASGLPPGATVGALGPFVGGVGTLTIAWTPGFDQAGIYSVRFDAYEEIRIHPTAWRDSCRTSITILERNPSPIARAGGPYTGVQDVPVTFDGTGSSDPEGGALEFAWSFGDGSTGAGPEPTHTYESGGTYPVSLTVRESHGLTAQDGTTATIAHVYPARVFARPGFEPTRVPNGRPLTCFQIEPPEPARFDLDAVDPSTLVLRYTDPVCGEREATPVFGKTHPVADTDRNGRPELAVCFDAEGLASLISCRPAGSHTLPLRLTATILSGDRIEGEFEHSFVSRGASLGARVVPNPLNPRGTLTFWTGRRGAVRAHLFDIQGRLVAELLAGASVGPGPHQVEIEGRDARGARLVSGIYFLRVWAEHDGIEVRPIAILR